MYVNTGYLTHSESDLENMKVPLQINACGVYRLIRQSSMSTLRPHGRSDYQLLYIASGKAFFTFENNSTEVCAGNMILYRPHEYQQYIYYLRDKPEVYWIHFTGYDAASQLSHEPFTRNHIFHTGTSSHYRELFFQIIRELQVSRPCCQELLPVLLQQLFLLIRRNAAEGQAEKHRLQKEMEHAVHYFNENYFRSIEIEQYAASLHMSTCWFIRSFKQYMGMPPLQYLTSIRISRAKELLKGTDYTISEIGAIVGYENPLYFSRIFKKQEGISPKGYRNKIS